MKPKITTGLSIQKRHMVSKIVTYAALLILSLAALIFILVTSQSNEPKFIIVSIGIWLLFALFCGYKIYRARQYRGIFRKGTINVGELDDMDGIAFEELACEILLANNFEIAETTPASGDYGVDILASRDGMDYAIQCKRWNGPVSLDAVQQVYAGRAFYECHVAVVLTNQYFTPNAQKLADKIGVVLWDRDMLRELL